MLVIGHRGGDIPENTLRAVAIGVKSGIDILHVDVRLTHDGVPILLHDASLHRTHKIDVTVGSLDFAELHRATSTECPPKLEQVLDRYFGKILINIELRSYGSAEAVYMLLKKYIKDDPSKWDLVFLSSSKVAELAIFRRLSTQANLALIQGSNPFAFIAHHRFLNLSAVGFHRLHTNALALQIARRAGIFTYAYTVDRPVAARKLARQGIDGIATDKPSLIIKALQK